MALGGVRTRNLAVLLHKSYAHCHSAICADSNVHKIYATTLMIRVRVVSPSGCVKPTVWFAAQSRAGALAGGPGVTVGPLRNETLSQSDTGMRD